MRNIDKIFIGLIILEVIVLAPFLLVKDSCSSQCRVDGLLNPFNILELSPKICTAVCVEGFYPTTYLIADILILTLIIFILTKLIIYLKGGMIK